MLWALSKMATTQECQLISLENRFFGIVFTWNAAMFISEKSAVFYSRRICFLLKTDAKLINCKLINALTVYSVVGGSPKWRPLRNVMQIPPRIDFSNSFYTRNSAVTTKTSAGRSLALRKQFQKHIALVATLSEIPLTSTMWGCSSELFTLGLNLTTKFRGSSTMHLMVESASQKIEYTNSLQQKNVYSLYTSVAVHRTRPWTRASNKNSVTKGTLDIRHWNVLP